MDDHLALAGVKYMNDICQTRGYATPVDVLMDVDVLFRVESRLFPCVLVKAAMRELSNGTLRTMSIRNG